jgi:hypothetical protein
VIYRRAVLLTCFCLLTTTTLYPVAAAQPALQPIKAASGAVGEHESVATIAINSYDNLLADANFIGGLAGYPEVGNMVEGFVALFTQGKGLVGLDKSKPWGVLITTDGTNFMPIGCLPVHDSKDLLQLLAAFQIKVDERDDGLVEIKPPNGPPLFVVEKDGWAYISNQSEYLDQLPTNPEQKFRSLVKDYDLAVQASIQKIPSEYRDLAINQLRAGMEEGLKREADEDDETFKTRQQWSETQLQNIVGNIEEIDRIVVGWAIDSGQQNTYVDFIYYATPGSALSQMMASVAANARSNYAGFYQPESAACLTFVAKSDPALNEPGIEKIKEAMSTFREQIGDAIDQGDEGFLKNPETKKTLKKVAFGLIAALEETAATGKSVGGAVLDLSPDRLGGDFDGNGIVDAADYTIYQDNLDLDAAVLNGNGSGAATVGQADYALWKANLGSSSGANLTLVVGGYVKDPSKIDSSLRELANIAEKESDFPGVNWNADEHEGITFHTMQVPIEDDDKQTKKLLGSKVDFSIGIGKESVYLGFGSDNLRKTKEIIDSSLAQPDKPMPIAEWMISLAPIMQVAAESPDNDDPQQKKILQTIAQMLRNESQGKDHIRAVGTAVENGFRYRVVAEEGVLRALGKAAETASQAAGGGGF